MKVKTTKSVLLLITLLFSATIVAQSFEFDGYTYELQSDQTLTVKGYVNNSITEIKIPDTVEFEGRSYPVTTIGENAFGGFGKLKDAVLTNNITVIEGSAFSYCFKLENINIPTNIVKIGSSCFNLCESLKDIVLPETLEEMGTHVFQNCTSFTEVTFPSKLKEIKRSVFNNCNGIKTINISKGVNKISPDFLTNCSSLKNINVERGNTNYKDIDGALYNITGDTLISLPPDNDKYIIEPGTKYILEYSLANNSEKPTLKIPASVIDIHENAFNIYRGILNINVDADNQHFSDIDGVLFSKNGKTLKRYPTGRSGEYIIPMATTVIDASAFYYCKGLTNITFSKNVKTINKEAFRECYGLTELVLPDNITKIGSQGFIMCVNLERIIFSDSIESIASSCFTYCYKLKSIKLPENLKVIEDRAFGSCYDLESVIIPEGTTVIRGTAFQLCKYLKRIYLPSTLTNIYNLSFSSLPNLSEVYLNKNSDMTKGSTIFKSSSISDATLYVPAGTKSMYESLSPWSDFGNIVEHESLTNSINQLKDEAEFQVTVNNGIVNIQNAPLNENIYLINSNGSIIKTIIGNGETLEFEISEQGVFIIRCGNNCFKVFNQNR